MLESALYLVIPLPGKKFPFLVFVEMLICLVYTGGDAVLKRLNALVIMFVNDIVSLVKEVISHFFMN